MECLDGEDLDSLLAREGRLAAGARARLAGAGGRGARLRLGQAPPGPPRHQAGQCVRHRRRRSQAARLRHRRARARAGRAGRWPGGAGQFRHRRLPRAGSRARAGGAPARAPGRARGGGDAVPDAGRTPAVRGRRAARGAAGAARRLERRASGRRCRPALRSTPARAGAAWRAAGAPGRRRADRSAAARAAARRRSRPTAPGRRAGQGRGRRQSRSPRARCSDAARAGGSRPPRPRAPQRRSASAANRKRRRASRPRRPRQVRKEALRHQLLERRALEAEKARQEREEAQRKARPRPGPPPPTAQSRSAPAPKRRRAVQAELAALLPTRASPVADAEGVLRDRFLDGSGRARNWCCCRPGASRWAHPSTSARWRWRPVRSRPGWRANCRSTGSASKSRSRWGAIRSRWASGARSSRATGWQPGGEVDWDAPGFPPDRRHPVVGVNWYDAVHYCAWLSAMTGPALPPAERSRVGIRLPRRHPHRVLLRRHHHHRPGQLRRQFHLQRRPARRVPRGTTPVDEFPANPWGLYDMHGNVWEWVQDVVHDNYDGAPSTAAPGKRAATGPPHAARRLLAVQPALSALGAAQRFFGSALSTTSSAFASCANCSDLV